MMLWQRSRLLTPLVLLRLCAFALKLDASEHPQPPQPLVIESGTAEYNGNEILLTGDVTVKHPIGTISSKKLSVFAHKNAAKKGDLSQLQINDDVSIVLQDGAKLECQKAHVDSIGLKALFFGNSTQPKVIYSHGAPDKGFFMIKSDQMQLDLVRKPDSKALFVKQIEAYPHVKGTYQQLKIEFSGDRLIWNNQDQTLTLQGHVKVDQEEKLLIKTDNIVISQATIDGKKIVQTIYSPKETEIIYYDDKKEESHKIICHGPIKIDNEQMQTWMFSPKNDYGNIIQDKQVYFEDPLGDMYADQILFKYSRQDQQIQLSSVILEGHVKMLNRFDGHMQESSSVLHYALADKVVYTPLNGEILLSSLEGSRVLFFDKVNKVQMSAPVLKVIRPGPNRKESISGMGDVRFTFVEGELKHFKNQFPLNPEIAVEK